MGKERPTNEAQGPAAPDVAELVDLASSVLRKRLQLTHPDWKPALTAVLNCYEACAMQIATSHGLFYPKDAIALTRLVLEQKARDDARADAAGKATAPEGEQ